MSPDRDDIDPSDWLASQFDDEPEPPKTARLPAQQPPAQQPPAQQPPAQRPGRPPLIPPAANPPATPTGFPATPPSWSGGGTASAAPTAPPNGAGAGGFVWGLTPGGAAAAPPAQTPPAAAPPAPVPPTPAPPPLQEPSPWPSASPSLEPAPTEPTPAPQYQAPQTYQPQQNYEATQNYHTTPPYQPPAQTYPNESTDRWSYDPLEQPTTAIERAPMPWERPAVDYSMEGGTELLSAEPVGLADPVNEGAPTSAIDSLFGATQFREYEDEPLIPPPPTRRDEAPPTGPREPRMPMPRTQKILLWVAGSLVAVLALIAVFLLGTRLAPTLRPAPVAIPSADATPTAAPPGTALGPLAPGEYTWSELRGGECLEPWESAWQDNYVVVDCATPHRAQLVYRGVFDDPAGTAYPGVEALQERTVPLCSAPTVIDFAAAAGATDIQVSSSFAGDEAEWNAGNPSFFCFVSRAGGEPLTGSLAVPAAAAPAA